MTYAKIGPESNANLVRHLEITLLREEVQTTLKKLVAMYHVECLMLMLNAPNVYSKVV
jgi:hypothetical protein